VSPKIFHIHIFLLFALSPNTIFAAAKTEVITFGQSAFLHSGSMQTYGKAIRNGIKARFNKANDSKELRGRILQLESSNDSGRRKDFLKNFREMRKKKMDMFFGNMGTGNNLSILPYVERKEIAQFFPWGSDDLFRQPQLTHIVNGLGLIAPQIKFIASYVSTIMKIKKVAIFYPDNSLGEQNKKLILQELKKFEIYPVAIESYNRLSMLIERTAKKLTKRDPKVVISLGTSMPTAKLANYFFEKGHFGTRFIGIDSTLFSGKILEEKGIKIPYTSPMPQIEKSDFPIVKEFKKDMKQYFPHFPLNTLSLAYYIHASIIIKGIKNIAGKVTKETLLEQITKMKKLDLGGFFANFNPMTRHAYDHHISLLES